MVDIKERRTDCRYKVEVNIRLILRRGERMVDIKKRRTDGRYKVEENIW